jgi:hypothetical protein
MFVWYSNQHKGYKCLDPSTGHVYISRDVIFDETMFPFASFHPNAGALLKSKILLLHPTLCNHTEGVGVEGPNVINTADGLIESYANHSADHGATDSSTDQRVETNPGVDPGIDSPTAPLHVAVLDLVQIGSSSESGQVGVPAGADLLHSGSSAQAAGSHPLVGSSSHVAATMDLVLVLLPVYDQVGSSILSGSGAGVVQCPISRLQNNIKRPKVYTDGTI